MEFLTCNAFERLVYQAVTQQAWVFLEKRDENLAIRIANAVSKAFNSGN